MSLHGRRSAASSLRLLQLILVAALVLVFLLAAAGSIAPAWRGVALGSGVALLATRFGFVAGLAALVCGQLLTLLMPGGVLATEHYLIEGALALPAVLLGGFVQRGVRRYRQMAQEQSRRTQLLTEAALALQKLDNTSAIYRTSLRMLSDILEFTHAAIFVPREDAMHLAASYQWEVPAGFRLSMESVTGEAARSRKPVYVPDVRRYPTYVPAPGAPVTLSELAIPLLVGDRLVAVLNIEHADVHAFGEQEYRTLIAFGSMIEEAIERAGLQKQLGRMLETTRSLAQSNDPESLYEQTVDSAIKLIPGAQAGSLMVLEETGFRFAAVAGYDPRLLHISGIGLETQLNWYGGGIEDFRAGKPRLMAGDQVREASLAGLETDVQRRTITTAGKVNTIAYNICAPVTLDGNITGILNIDSFSEANPFAQNALLLAETFAQQIAVIMRQTQYRDALEKALVTDTLTGLGNREGFNKQLAMEIARAKRYGHRFNLVMIDLDGFKRINDRYGHHEGDRALVKVSMALQAQRREGDGLFRWAGDEFAVILPEVISENALTAAERYVAAIAAIPGLDLTASFGLASYPEDGTEAESLLRKADDLMYRDKAAW